MLLTAILVHASKITAADPSRRLSKLLHFSINTRLDVTSGEGKTFWSEAEGVSDITINLPQGAYVGKTISMTL